jgi:asparagine synthetase B (glutamine-hydrolysing)
MSFLFYYGPIQDAPNPKNLQDLLCPYDLPVHRHQVGPRAFLFFNDFSELKDQDLLTPKSHQMEKNAAWSLISIQNSMVHFSTDPLRQCPLWFIDEKNWKAISPEQKAFKIFDRFHFKNYDDNSAMKIRPHMTDESEFENVYRMNSSSAKMDIHSGELFVESKPLPWQKQSPAPFLSSDLAEKLLYESLCKSSEEIPLGPTASLLSGGVDSGVASSLAKARCPNLKCYNLSTSLGNETHDSMQTSEWLGVSNETLVFVDQQLEQDFQSLIWKNELTDGLTAEILVQLDFMISKLEEKSVVTGYGSDLLFGSMLNHSAYMAATGVSDTESLLNRTVWSKEFSPFYYWSRRKRLFHLFWHPDVIQTALQIPPEMNFEQNQDKIILRTMAVRQNILPTFAAFRIKKGMTDGTQMHLILSRMLQLKNDYEYIKKTNYVYQNFKKNFEL